MEMAKYIMAILKTNLTVVFSWGFHNPIALHNGLKFRVNGFKHKGWVSVVYNAATDLFDITLTNRKGSETIEGIYLDNLIDVIDYRVEYTGANYEKDVTDWLKGA